MVGIIGKKLGMTQVYDDKGLLIPVTVIEAGPCPVLEVRTQDKDTYSALQVGFGSKRAKNVLKPVLGHLAKTNNHENPPAVIKESSESWLLFSILVRRASATMCTGPVILVFAATESVPINTSPSPIELLSFCKSC